MSFVVYALLSSESPPISLERLKFDLDLIFGPLKGYSARILNVPSKGRVVRCEWGPSAATLTYREGAQVLEDAIGIKHKLGIAAPNGTELRDRRVQVSFADGPDRQHTTLQSINGYVPDLPVGEAYGVTDVKGGVNITNSDQLRAFYKYAVEHELPSNLIISSNTESISGPLLDNIRATGGPVMQYDDFSDMLSIVDMGSSGSWVRGNP